MAGAGAEMPPRRWSMLASLLGAALVVAALCWGCYPKCPDRKNVVVDFTVTSDFEEVDGTVLFDGDVEVLAVEGSDGHWGVDMRGAGFDGIEHDIHLTLVVTPSVDLPLAEGDILHMQYVKDAPMWENWYLSLKRDGVLVLALVDQAIVVEGEMWVDDLRIDVRTGRCPQNSDDCGAHERAGIRVTHPEGQSVLVMDHRWKDLEGTPAYRIQAQRVIVNYDNLFVPCPTRERGRLVAMFVKLSP